MKDDKIIRELMSKLCLETSLYAVEELKEDLQVVVASLRTDDFQIDAHCIHCRREVVFKTER